jgi:hypothetical protein
MKKDDLVIGEEYAIKHSSGIGPSFHKVKLLAFGKVDTKRYAWQPPRIRMQAQVRYETGHWEGRTVWTETSAIESPWATFEAAQAKARAEDERKKAIQTRAEELAKKTSIVLDNMRVENSTHGGSFYAGTQGKVVIELDIDAANKLFGILNDAATWEKR